MRTVRMDPGWARAKQQALANEASKGVLMTPERRAAEDAELLEVLEQALQPVEVVGDEGKSVPQQAATAGPSSCLPSSSSSSTTTASVADASTRPKRIRKRTNPVVKLRTEHEKLLAERDELLSKLHRVEREKSGQALRPTTESSSSSMEEEDSTDRSSAGITSRATSGTSPTPTPNARSATPSHAVDPPSKHENKGKEDPPGDDPADDDPPRDDPPPGDPAKGDDPPDCKPLHLRPVATPLRAISQGSLPLDELTNNVAIQIVNSAGAYVKWAMAGALSAKSVVWKTWSRAVGVEGESG